MQATVDSVTKTSMPALTSLLQVRSGLYESDSYLYKEVTAYGDEFNYDEATAIRDINDFSSQRRVLADQVVAQFASFAAQLTPGTSAARQAAAISANLPQWQKAQQSLEVSYANADDLLILPHAVAERQLADTLVGNLNQLVGVVQTQVLNGEQTASAEYQNRVRQLIAVALLAACMALLLGEILARFISRPLSEVERAAEHLAVHDMASLNASFNALADGDFTVSAAVTATMPSYVGRDETGRTAEAMRTIIRRMQDTVSAHDRARRRLAGLITEVAQTSCSVTDRAAYQSTTSVQLGRSSMHIARAVEEVARGASEQSRDSLEGLNQVATLSREIERVAEGAKAQHRAMDEAQSAIDDLKTALDDTSRTALSVDVAASSAAATAKDGGAAIVKTISSIDNVRAAVSSSAGQVLALGTLSREINHIVEAIDEIAAETNLLAINASIEAANAGKHGKGFKVVAGHVRKLAQKAADETRKISGLIQTIHRQIDEVVDAMTKGSAEVERSAALGRTAEVALQGIVGVIEETSREVKSITEAVSRMAATMARVSTATSNVAAVADETAAAASLMHENAGVVRREVEAISTIAEENASAAEEVSASTQEQNASVALLGEGAHELAGLAGRLNDLVSRFRLELATPDVDPRPETSAPAASRDTAEVRRRAQAGNRLEARL